MKNLTLGILFCSLLALAACGSDGGGSTSANDTVPSAPTNLTVMAGRGHLNETTPGNYVVIRWDAVPGATSYTLYHDATSNVTTSSYSVTGVTSPYAFPTPADYAHYFAVSASNSAGESALSSVKRMAVLIPQTGQTTRYAAGDDGDLHKGVAWPTTRFILAGATVTDTLTGLMWQTNTIASVGWEAALNLCAISTIGGYTDWRLPNRRELLSLMDYSSSLEDEWYWTSTTNAQTTTQAWAVKTGTGAVAKGKLDSYLVLAVRDDFLPTLAELPRTGQTIAYFGDDDGLLEKGVIWPGRFFDHGDGRVTDWLTGLMWLSDAGTTGAATWPHALSAVAACAVGGHHDWRLPNVKELETLLDMSAAIAPCLPSAHPFTGVQNAPYWTSTTKEELVPGANAWYIDFGNGSIQTAAKDPTTCYVWPVRSTQ